MTRKLLVIVALLLMSVSSASFAEDTRPLLRSISTNGEAIVYVTPDEAIVNFGVQTFNASLDKSKSDNDDESAKLLKAVKALGIEEKHIQTDQLQVTIQYKDYNRGGHGNIEGYMASRSYSVKLKDVKLLDKLVDAALKNGANQFHGISFQTTELRKHRDEARKLAIKAAKEKAVALAGELEMKVGKPRTISESGSFYYSGGYGGGRFNNMAQNSVQNNAGPGDDSQVTPLGQIAVSANVSVTFDME